MAARSQRNFIMGNRKGSAPEPVMQLYLRRITTLRLRGGPQSAASPEKVGCGPAPFDATGMRRKDAAAEYNLVMVRRICARRLKFSQKKAEPVRAPLGLKVQFAEASVT